MYVYTSVRAAYFSFLGRVGRAQRRGRARAVPLLHQPAVRGSADAARDQDPPRSQRPQGRESLRTKLAFFIHGISSGNQIGPRNCERSVL